MVDCFISGCNVEHFGFERKLVKGEAMNYYKRLIKFCQELIRTPSLSGQEKACAELVYEEMNRLGYDKVMTDPAGNVIGVLRGARDHPLILFTTHMDHVPPGDHAQWPFGAYSGALRGGSIYGCGASDAKGALATMVYLVEALKLVDLNPDATIIVAGVVGEEVGGIGSRVLLNTIPKPDFVILGEASDNELRHANRGRVRIKVIFRGNRGHAALVSLENNVIFAAAKLVLSLTHLQRIGKIGVSRGIPVTITSANEAENVIASSCEIILDWRINETEEINYIIKLLKKKTKNMAEIMIPQYELTTYTNNKFAFVNAQPPFWTPPDDPVIIKVRDTLQRLWRRNVPVKCWKFTTDAGFFAEKGSRVIGFSPGHEDYAHTYNDKICIRKMIEAWLSYPHIIKTLEKSYDLVATNQP
jgi:putative selenium metabolism hydrolase